MRSGPVQSARHMASVSPSYESCTSFCRRRRAQSRCAPFLETAIGACVSGVWGCAGDAALPSDAAMPAGSDVSAVGR